jgi:hypothetical protein
MASCSSSASRSLSRVSRSTCSGAVDRHPRDGARSCVTTHRTLPPWTCSLFRPLASTCSMSWHRPARTLRPCLDQRHNKSDSRMDRASDNGSIPLEWGAALPHPRSGSNLWRHRNRPIASHGHPGQACSAGLALAEWLCRTTDWIDPARVRGSFHRLGRGASAPNSADLRRLLQFDQNTPVVGQRCTGFAPRSADRIY